MTIAVDWDITNTNRTSASSAWEKQSYQIILTYFCETKNMDPTSHIARAEGNPQVEPLI